MTFKRLSLIVIVALLAGFLAACDTLNAGDVMRAGGTITSANGAMTLIQQSDGNLVLYDACGARWSSNTSGNPGAWTIMQTDGNLVVYSADNRPLWWSGTNGHPGAHVVVQNDGDLVIYHGSYPVWASFTRRCLFDDEFTRAGLDLTKWRPNWDGPTDTAITHPPNDITKEVNCFDPAQVAQPGDGYLYLTAMKRSCTTWEGATYQYASGNVSTTHKFDFTYGRLEARMWLPPGSGPVQNWPGFWATGYSWPATGEIDVVEGLGAGKDCWHFHADYVSTDDPGGCPSLANPSGWHTFTADWRHDGIFFSYDGKQVGKVTSGVTGAPMFVDVQHSLHADKTIHVPAQVIVDYVRVDANIDTR